MPLDESVVQAAAETVVQSVSADRWSSLRQAVARWFGHGDTEREQVTLARLDATVAAVEAAVPREMHRVRAAHQMAWRVRFEDILKEAQGADREQLLRELRELVAAYSTADNGPSHGAVQVNIADGQGRVYQAGRDMHLSHRPPGPEHDPDDDWPRDTQEP